MSTTYRTVSGDTWDLIARKTTGDDRDAGVIQAANPGVSEPLSAGISITVPIPGVLDVGGATDDGGNEVSLYVDGETFVYWETITISRAIDSISKMVFTSPFDPDNRAFRRVFRPDGFKSVVVTIGGKRIFTGVMVPQPPTSDPSGSQITVDAFSIPGVLEQCSAPESVWPIEFRRHNLREITDRILKPFGVQYMFESDPGPAFKKVKMQPTSTIFAFLTPLAQQRGYVISDDSDGFMVYRQSTSTGSPVAVLREGVAPLVSVAPSFNFVQYYSHVTGLKPARAGSRAARYTAANTFLNRSLRPSVFTAGDTDAGEIEDATNAKLGRMFGNAATYTATIATWRDPRGSLWRENTTVKVLYPSAMIYQEYEFLVRRVNLSQTPTEEVAVLELVMPGAFSGEIPEELPWAE